MIIGYTLPEIWHVTNIIVIFHFGLFFAPPPGPPKSQNNENFKKKKKRKNTRRYHFTQVHQKS